MSRDDLFNTNASIAMNLGDACARCVQNNFVSSTIYYVIFSHGYLNCTDLDFPNHRKVMSRLSISVTLTMKTKMSGYFQKDLDNNYVKTLFYIMVVSQG